ncbi:MAG: hypothetical protein KGO92_06855 [Bacteroidota bacterium]|nr:hypothetical protein [Bacteroidota bacterium]
MNKNAAFLMISVSFGFLSCSSKPNIETRVKKFMKDSVVNTFNDPSSYEFVSMTVDTFKLKDYISNTRLIYGDTTHFDSIKAKNELARAAELEKRNIDSIINYQIKVKYRGKNAMGALTLNEINLIFDPLTDKLVKSEFDN